MKILDIELKRPVCNSSGGEVNAVARLDTDLTYLLTYINAAAEKPRYYPGVPYIAFRLEDHRVVVEKDQVRVYGLEGEDEARGLVERAVDYIREVDSRKDGITPSESPYDPPKVMDVYKALPKKTGCGRCGYPTCMAFATAIAAGEAEMEDCTEL